MQPIEPTPLPPARTSLDPAPASSRSVIVATHGFSGPLPSPEMLAAYKAIDPSLVERIVALAESSSAQEYDAERAILEVEKTDRHAYRMQVRFGQCFAFGVAVIGLVSSVYTTVYGFPITGGVIGGGTLVSIVGAFLFHERHQKPGTVESVTRRS